MDARKTGVVLMAAFASITPSIGRSIHLKNQTITQMELSMLTDHEKKNTILRIYEECLNKRNMNLLREFISEDYKGINGLKGPAAFEAPVTALINSFPDVQWTIEDIVEDDDKVFVSWHWTGTHKENYQHIAASGAVVTNTGMAVFSFRDGKVIESKVQTDRLGFLQELHQLPRDLSAIRAVTPDRQQIIFIDRFVVPQPAYKEFYERVLVNRNFIKGLSGFVRDEAFEMKDAAGNIIFITVAVWANEDVFKNAKAAVQQEYSRQGFDITAFLKRLNISMERGNFKPAGV